MGKSVVVVAVVVVMKMQSGGVGTVSNEWLGV
jgi:hypothetical protein